MILITGVAGFIGYHVAHALLKKGHQIIGVDNLSPYYDVHLKRARLSLLVHGKEAAAFSFYENDITDRAAITHLFEQNPGITYIVHLAAQAGVRYSLKDPYTYAQTNVLGHVTILEGARTLLHLKHCVYASSSSVYGANTTQPFSVQDRTDLPMSVYAATKKSSEMLSAAYTSLYDMPMTGLRFFTVYGPWGRPDMAASLFTESILAGKPLSVFNHGAMQRNFTYIDDIVDGVVRCLFQEDLPEKIYNLGNNRAASLMDFIAILEKQIGKKAMLQFEDIQKGDVPNTLADISESKRDFDFQPCTDIQQGLTHFVDWYRDWYKGKNYV